MQAPAKPSSEALHVLVVDDGGHTAVVRQVRGEYFRPDPVIVFQLSRAGPEPLLVPCHEDHVVPLLGELAGEFGPEAGRCAGDQGGERRGG